VKLSKSFILKCFAIVIGIGLFLKNQLNLPIFGQATNFIKKISNIIRPQQEVFLKPNLIIGLKKNHDLVTVAEEVNTKVAVAKGLNLPHMTRQAIGQIGGIESIVKPQQKVFIKPNLITGGLGGHDPVKAGEIPHPDIVSTVAELCLKAGAKEVIIGEWMERPPKIIWGNKKTAAYFTGYKDRPSKLLFGGKEGKEGAQLLERVRLLNKRYGHKVHLLNLKDHTAFFYYFPSKTQLRQIAIPDLVIDADVVISIAVLKTHHRPSPVTFGMKNLVGIMPSILYGEPRYKLHQAGMHQILIDITKAVKPQLTIISGAYGLEGDGTTLFLGGETVSLQERIGNFLIIAGTDPIATDATATRIISENWQPKSVDTDLGTPWHVHHLRMAYLQGIGEIRKSKIKIVGTPLEEVAMSWKLPKDNPYPELPQYYEQDLKKEKELWFQ